MSETLKKTHLNEVHRKLGGKMVPFAGWEMPVQYSGLIQEHMATRQTCGIFDVSHMGEVIVSGPEAEKTLDYMTCNNLKNLQVGKAQYSAILNEQGGVVDDIIIYRMPESFLVCVNASNAEKDFNWLKDHNIFDATVEDHSDKWGQIALQGPLSVEILKTVPGGEELAALKFFNFSQTELGGVQVTAARTGYTGEDGFEFFVSAADTEKLWTLLYEAGQEHNIVPVGLGARDTLRLESCFSLYGHELRDNLSVLEAGLGWIVHFEKNDFIGCSALIKLKEQGLRYKQIAFQVEDRGIVREDARIFSQEDKEIGYTTSGTRAPLLDKSIGLAIVEKDSVKTGDVFYAEVRNRRLKCLVAEKPFYKRSR